MNILLYYTFSEHFLLNDLRNNVVLGSFFSSHFIFHKKVDSYLKFGIYGYIGKNFLFSSPAYTIEELVTLTYSQACALIIFLLLRTNNEFF